MQFSVILSTLVCGGVLPFCRGAYSTTPTDWTVKKYWDCYLAFFFIQKMTVKRIRFTRLEYHFKLFLITDLYSHKRWGNINSVIHLSKTLSLYKWEYRMTMACAHTHLSQRCNNSTLLLYHDSTGKCSVWTRQLASRFPGYSLISFFKPKTFFFCSLALVDISMIPGFVGHWCS